MKGDKLKLNEVKDNRWEDLLRHETNQGGEYLCFAHEDTPTNLVAIIVCPRCKRPGRCGKHKVIRETPLTLDGTFLCTQKVKGQQCGYHAEVRDGFFIEL